MAKRNNIPLYVDGYKGADADDGGPYAEAAASQGRLRRVRSLPRPRWEQINLVPDAYRGMDRFEARKAVIADIDAEGLMIEVEDKKIMAAVL